MNKNRRAVPARLMMLLVLCLVALVITLSFVSAVPPAAPPAPNISTIPTVTGPLPNVTLTVNSVVNASNVTMVLSHNAPVAVDCAVFSNATCAKRGLPDSLCVGNSSGSFMSFTPNAANRTTVTLTGFPVGTFTFSTTCYVASSRNPDASYGVVYGGDTDTVTVLNDTLGSVSTNANYSITMFFPPQNVTPSFNVTYMHNSTTSSCSVVLDGTVVDQKASLPSLNLWRKYLNNVPLGTHTISVNCSNAAWAGSVSQNINVMNETNQTYYSGLTISPSAVYPGTNISINGAFTAYSMVVVTITPPAGAATTFSVNLSLNGQLATSYYVDNAARQGTYVVSGLGDDGTLNNGTFTVINRSSSIMVSGNKTNVTFGTTFTVVGYQFLANDNTTLRLIGGGSTWTNSTYTSVNGAFAFTYPSNVPVGTYTITARSSDNNVVVTMPFSVLSPSVVQNDSNTTPIIGLGNPTENATQNQSGEQPTPVFSNPSPEPSPSPTPIPTPSDTQQPASSSGFSWWLIPIILVVILGGAIGFLVYNGTLDASSVEAFKDSVQNMMNGSLGKSSGKLAGPGITGAPIDGADGQIIKSFIFGERTKGFDDLTIRSALLAKGWDKTEVDRVFDEMYKNG